MYMFFGDTPIYQRPKSSDPAPRKASPEVGRRLPTRRIPLLPSSGVSLAETLILLSEPERVRKPGDTIQLADMCHGHLWNTMRSRTELQSIGRLLVMSDSHGLCSAHQPIIDTDPVDQSDAADLMASIEAGGVIATNSMHGLAPIELIRSASGDPWRCVIIQRKELHRRAVGALIAEAAAWGLISVDAPILIVEGGVGSRCGQLARYLDILKSTQGQPVQSPHSPAAA